MQEVTTDKHHETRYPMTLALHCTHTEVHIHTSQGTSGHQYTVHMNSTRDSTNQIKGQSYMLETFYTPHEEVVSTFHNIRKPLNFKASLT